MEALLWLDFDESEMGATIYTYPPCPKHATVFALHMKIDYPTNVEGCTSQTSEQWFRMVVHPFRPKAPHN
jgi:hypothetical protein